MGKKQTDTKTTDHINAQPRFHQRATRDPTVRNCEPCSAART